MNKLPSCRQEAIRLKQKYFYTGRPCKYGHLSKRDTVNGACMECNRIRAEKLRNEAREALKAA